MKIPLRYQISEYDCGPTSLLNALSYLFEREEIPPDVIRNIMLYSLDCYGTEGVLGKQGTSRSAMMFLSHWLAGLGNIGRMPVSCRYLQGEQVFLGDNSYVTAALQQKGAVVIRSFYEVEHYMLLTGVTARGVLAFDPYYETKPLAADVEVVTDCPFSHNRCIPAHYLNSTERNLYALGPQAEREALLLFNTRTRLTENRTIEYFI